MNFKVGQRIRVKSLNGYMKHEHELPDMRQPLPEIGKTYVIRYIHNTNDCQVLWLYNTLTLRGIYSEDCEDATTKLDKALL